MLQSRCKRVAVRGSDRPGLAPISRRRVTLKPVCSASAEAAAAVAPQDLVTLAGGLTVPVLGVGAWSWGDRSGYWGYGREYGKEESRAAYQAMIARGLTFIDTAEVYGFGKSEEFLGEFIREQAPALPRPVVATKFAPLPWRFTAASVTAAAKASLGRMGLPSMGLYMQHWPGYGPQYFFNDAYLQGLADCKDQGLCQAVGVSNFSAARVRGAVKLLGSRGVPLASNQVQYSLLYRAPETSGVLEACREAGVMPVAYSPLCQGLLTGKYSASGAKPSGPRALVYGERRLTEVAPVIEAVRAIATERGKSMAQVSLNWVICKGALPIPGAKNAKQLDDVAGALGWRLSEGEVAELDRVSAKIPPGQGFPVENW
ncbi:hypothetical protein HXX76_011956 [Chlamydomonas incerta]|uniref:NADP-dependent oxidoreductase domain-containing protein n=1 Tax=Chlamydomonas incerta TaxID=51695 RepID=A0A835STH1_CHLIN|nr:hypothetical protein HXX76_011956 [Chlamydomonas incerta]|eukprot:KAG2427969.1 hypothetical protein HXX76_011956 [Chlamydomonas incerta]